MEPAYRYRAACARVIDGDTYVLDVDLGFRCAVSVEARLRDVNCPEVHGATRDAGLAAAAYAATLLYGAALIVESYRDRRSFARWVCDVWLADGSSLADALVAAGHAVRV